MPFKTGSSIRAAFHRAPLAVIDGETPSDYTGGDRFTVEHDLEAVPDYVFVQVHEADTDGAIASPVAVFVVAADADEVTLRASDDCEFTLFVG
jgi:hypothetical protein